MDNNAPTRKLRSRRVLENTSGQSRPGGSHDESTTRKQPQLGKVGDESHSLDKFLDKLSQVPTSVRTSMDEMHAIEKRISELTKESSEISSELVKLGKMTPKDAPLKKIRRRHAAMISRQNEAAKLAAKKVGMAKEAQGMVTEAMANLDIALGDMAADLIKQGYDQDEIMSSMPTLSTPFVEKSDSNEPNTGDISKLTDFMEVDKQLEGPEVINK